MLLPHDSRKDKLRFLFVVPRIRKVSFQIWRQYESEWYFVNLECLEIGAGHPSRFDYCEGQSSRIFWPHTKCYFVDWSRRLLATASRTCSRHLRDQCSTNVDHLAAREFRLLLLSIPMNKCHTRRIEWGVSAVLTSWSGSSVALVGVCVASSSNLNWWIQNGHDLVLLLPIISLARKALRTDAIRILCFIISTILYFIKKLWHSSKRLESLILILQHSLLVLRFLQIPCR